MMYLKLGGTQLGEVGFKLTLEDRRRQRGFGESENRDSTAQKLTDSSGRQTLPA